MTRPEADAISKILSSAKNIAVVGLSKKPYRASFGVSETLQSSGYRIFPVNPMENEILGEKCYARLEDTPEKIDIVNFFPPPNFARKIVDGAIRTGARA